MTNKAGQALSAGGTNYTAVTTIYANDLAIDISPSRGDEEVSIGLICQADKTGDVVIAIRGTEGTREWMHDAEFLQVPCPLLPGAGHTDDGFTAMYESLRTGVASNSPTVVNALAKLSFPHPASSVTIWGHSLGGALATLLAPWTWRRIRHLRTRPFIRMAVRARGIRCLQAPSTKWSRTRIGLQID